MGSRRGAQVARKAGRRLEVANKVGMLPRVANQAGMLAEVANQLFADPPHSHYKVENMEY